MNRALAIALAGLLSAPASAVPPRNPDTFVYLTISDADSLDPAWSYDTASHELILNLYEPLVDYKGSSVEDFVARVAAEVPSVANGGISKDGKTYVFKIRKGVKFHAGGTVEPEDVRYSLMRFMLFDRDGGPSSLILEPVTGLPGTRKDGKLIDGIYKKVADRIQVSGDRVVVTLHKPFAPFLSILASWSPILDKSWAVENGEWDGTAQTLKEYNNPEKESSYLYDHVNGTGPFELERWDKRNKTVVFKRFDGYWRGPAKLQRVLIKGVDEFQTRKLMIAAGDADSIYSQWSHYPLLKNIPGVELLEDLPSVEMNPMVFFTFDVETQANPNVGSGKLDGRGVPADFFADADVRKAFAHCLDAEAYISDLMRGRGTVAPSFIPKGLLGYDESLPVRAFDPKKAEEHFRKAMGGKVWTTGFHFTITYNQGNEPRMIIANMLKRNVERLNPKFKIDTRPVQWSTFLDDSNGSKLPIFIMGWAADYPDPHNFAFPIMHSAGNFPRLQRYKNPEADALVTAAMTEIDPKKRRAMYLDLQRIFYDDVPSLAILNSVKFRTQRDWVKGYVHNPIWPSAPYSSQFYGLEKR